MSKLKVSVVIRSQNTVTLGDDHEISARRARREATNLIEKNFEVAQDCSERVSIIYKKLKEEFK